MLALFYCLVHSEQHTTKGRIPNLHKQMAHNLKKLGAPCTAENPPNAQKREGQPRDNMKYCFPGSLDEIETIKQACPLSISSLILDLKGKTHVFIP